MVDSAGLIDRAPAPLLASPQLQPEPDSPKGGKFVLEKVVDGSLSSEKPLVLDSSGEAPTLSSDEYAKLLHRILLVALMVSALAVSIGAFFFGFHVASSLLAGALSGILYLWLLGRSVGKLGNGSKNVSKTQLLVPIVLFLVVVRLPQLELIPAILGFLLYKPAMIIQVLLESWETSNLKN